MAEHSDRPTVTAVVTSCRRFDLLGRTLRSFIAHNDYPLEKLVVIEDSDDEGVKAALDAVEGLSCELIINGQNLGQIRSIDRAYAAVASDYIFHFEDDWEFTRGGFIAAGVECLEKEPNAIMAIARHRDDMPRYVRSLKTRDAGGHSYRRIYPEVHHLWYTFTFNPGLRRTSEWHDLEGGYNAIGDEGAISRLYKQAGRDMLWLSDGGVKHIGDQRSNYGGSWGFGRSRQNMSVRRFLRPSNFQKWSQSLRRRFWHRLRLLGVDTEALQRKQRPRSSSRSGPGVDGPHG